MTSYTGSRESVPLPGAFPTDDMTPTSEHPSLTSSGPHHQHNKLHKREAPGGWNDEQKAVRGHQYTDSGIGLSDSRISESQAYGRANEGAFNSNKNVSQGQSAMPGTAATTTARSTDYHDDQSKPGVMTGAYSRIGGSNYSQTHSKPTTQDQTTTERTATGIGAVGSATGIATTARSHDSEQNLKNEDRNIVRNGLTQSSNLEHKDPYWGDVSYGTGIYNGVTGHGSAETPTKGSVHPHDHALSHEQQRAFPLSTSSNTTHDETGYQNSSGFKEGLAESGAGGGAGVAVSGLAEKHRDHHDEKNLEKVSAAHKHHDTGAKKESKIAGLFHRDHKEKETKPEKYDTKERKLEEGTVSKDSKPLKEREAGAALAAATAAYGAKDHAGRHNKQSKGYESTLKKEDGSHALYEHPNEKINEPTAKAQPQLSKDPFVAAGYHGPNSPSTVKSSNNTYPTSEDVTTWDHPFTSQVAEKSTEKNDSRLGYGLAGVGAGPGAGYAAHEYANKDGAKHQDHNFQPTYNTPTTATSKGLEQSSKSGYATGQSQPGIASGTTAIPASSEKQHTPTQASSNVSHSHANPTHHDKYNTLADGTPSGINVDHHHGDKNNTITSSPSTGYNTSTKDNHTGTKAAAAGAGVASAAGAAHYAGNRDSDKISTSETRQTAAPSSREVHEPYMETTSTAANARTSTDPSRHGEYNVLNDGTPSGINVGSHYGDKNGTTSSPTSLHKPSSANNHAGAKAATAAGAGAAVAHHNNNDNKTAVSSPAIRDYQPGATSPSSAQNTAAAATTKGHTRNRSSTDSSHGGQYNVLSSGTPSGINIGDRGHLGRKSLDDNKNSTTNSANAKASATAVSAGAAPKRGIAGAGTAAGVGVGATAAATAPAALRSGDRVVHRCRKCGEENDLTEYFRK
ncbi:hypothetical protein F5Y06DRAFT_308101 [Hypoxylon sp. FL0890]|nr:hypothetical protein F5Y06DRAFT_308101 [Hypoxylon sp. FL0890]